LSDTPPAQAGTGERRVFVSYARADKERVQPIVEALSAEGCEVWWDSHILGGTTFAREIEAALNAAQAVVVVWSAASVDSDWVRDEAMVARDRGRIVPVRIDPVTAPLGFGQYHMVDLGGWAGDRTAASFRGLIEAIDHAVAGDAPRREATPAPDSPRGLNRRRALVIAGAAIPAVAVAGWWLAQRLAPERSVAVLPFANLSGDPAQDLVADGVSEDVRSALARIPALQVTSRTSSELSGDKRQDPSTVASRLGVAFLLEGTLQKVGDMLRISAQLVRGADGFEHWSQTFDRPTGDLLALESDIAREVAAALRVTLLAAQAVAPGGTRSADAYKAYLQARKLYDAGGDEASLRQTAALYEQALALDPDYADAQAGRARALMAIADQYAAGETRRSLSDQGLAAAEAAAQLAPDSADAQAALGFARMGRLDVKGAGGPYQRAGQLGAGDADRLEGYGAYEARLGRFELALPALRRAVLLDPLNPNAHLALGDGLYMARRPAEARDSLGRALQLNGAMTFAHSRLGDCLLLAGDSSGSLAEYRAEPAALYRLAGLAIALQRLGKTADARAALAELTTQTGDNGLYQQAQVQAQWGQTGPCLDALERGFALKDAGLTRLKVDPMLDPVRADRRFVRLLSLVGFA
jgi:TolB-like protein